MVVKVKNRKLHKETYKKLDKYHNKALSAYNKGNMKQGKKWENKGTKLYAKNYKKMFEVKK